MTTNLDPGLTDLTSLARNLADFDLETARSQPMTEPELYKKYSAAGRDGRAGQASVRDMYRLVETAAERGTLFSSQTEPLQANGTWGTDQLHRQEPPPAVLVDFGCSTGVLTSRLARQFPAARVIGLNHEANFVAIARASNRWSNLTFEQNDYGVPASGSTLGVEHPKAEAAIVTLGIDFDTPLSPPIAAVAIVATDSAPHAPASLDFDTDESAITSDAELAARVPGV